jgi:hypothetical protein
MATRNGSVRMVIYATQYARGVRERTQAWRSRRTGHRVARMGKRLALLIVACAALLAVAASSATAKPKVVKAKFRASYAFNGLAGTSWDLPADGFCPGVHWDENAQAAVNSTFKPFKLSLQSNAHATAAGAVLWDGDWSAHGNYYPDNDCGAQPQQSSCSGKVDFDHPDAVTSLLTVFVQKGNVIFTTGAGNLLERQEGGGCNDNQVLAGPALMWSFVSQPFDQVVGRVSLKTLAKKKTIKIHMGPSGDVPQGFSPDDCDHREGTCKAFFEPKKTTLTLKRIG